MSIRRLAIAAVFVFPTATACKKDRGAAASGLKHDFGVLARPAQDRMEACQQPAGNAADGTAQLQSYLADLGREIMRRTNASLTAQGRPPVFAGELAPEKFCFLVEDDDLNLNAVAVTLNRTIRVKSGTLLAVQTDADLAGVLSHELAHITMQHGFLREYPPELKTGDWVPKFEKYKARKLHLDGVTQKLSRLVETRTTEIETVTLSDVAPTKARELSEREAKARADHEREKAAFEVAQRARNERLTQAQARYQAGINTIQKEYEAAMRATPADAQGHEARATAKIAELGVTLKQVQDQVGAESRPQAAALQRALETWLPLREQVLAAVPLEAAAAASPKVAKSADLRQRASKQLDKLNTELADTFKSIEQEATTKLGSAQNTTTFNLDNWREVEADEVGFEIYLRSGFQPMLYHFHRRVGDQVAGFDSCRQMALAAPPVRGRQTHPANCWRIFDIYVKELQKDHKTEYDALIEAGSNAVSVLWTEDGKPRLPVARDAYKNGRPANDEGGF